MKLRDLFAPSRWSLALRLGLGYVLFGFIWILCSDYLLDLLTTDHLIFRWIQTAKGWVFVGLSGVVIAIIASRYVGAEDRRRALIEEGRERDLLFRLMAENFRDLIVIVNPDGSIEYVSPSIERLLDVPAAGFVGRHVKDWVDPRHGERLDKLKRGLPAQIRVRNKAGAWVWLEAISFSIQWRGTEHLVGIARDVTERKLAEEELLRGMEFTDSAINSIPGIFCVFDADSRLLRWNANLERIAGYGARELAQSRAARLLEDAEGESVDWYIQRVLSRGRADTRLLLETRGGERIPFLFTGYRFRSGTRSFVVGVGTDLSRFEEAEAALRESEERFRTIFDSAPTGIVIMNEAAGIQVANAAFYAMTGYTAKQLKGRNFFDLLAPEFSDLAERFRTASTDGAPLEYGLQAELLQRNGRRMWVSLTTNRMLMSQGDEQYVVMLENITKRKQAELRLEEYAQQLKALSGRLLDVQEEERRHIARELHDEVGQALTAVKINLESLGAREGLAKNAALQDSVSEVSRVLDQVRDLSLDLRPAMLDRLGLVPALRNYLYRQADRVGFEPIFDAPADGVAVDGPIETACFRVAQEALNNVVKHAGATRVSIELHADTDGLNLKIEDNGCGFAIEDKLHEASDGQTFGLLGLQERAKLVGGELTINSHPGVGTRIEAQFPRSLVLPTLRHEFGEA